MKSNNDNLKPYLIKGNFFQDNRGRIDFFNNFDLSKIKRIYFTTNKNAKTFRAWQGHKIENRWFYCVRGSFIIKIIKIDNWEMPSDDLKIIEYNLKENKPLVLFVPKGYVTGFISKSLDSKLMVLADYKFGDNPNDNYKFDNTKWIKK